jgi:ADP-ribose pyrophosphatase YjhB (NUDIX family)
MATVIRGDRVGRQGRLAIGCSASVFDVSGHKVLLTRRADNGRWCPPGGYMEPGEDVAEACAREVLEETGLQVRVTRLVAVYSSPHMLLEYPDGNRFQMVVLHFVAEPIAGDPTITDETTAIQYFTAAEVEGMEMGEIDRARIVDAFAAQAAAFIR